MQVISNRYGRQPPEPSSLAGYRSPSYVTDLCRLWSGRTNNESYAAVLENKGSRSIPREGPKECCSLEPCVCAQIFSARTLSTTRRISNKRPAPEPPCRSSECSLHRSLFQEDRLPAEPTLLATQWSRREKPPWVESALGKPRFPALYSRRLMKSTKLVTWVTWWRGWRGVGDVTLIV